MAGFSETIKIILDVVGDKASGALKGFGGDLDETGNKTNKLKTMAGGAFDSIKANAAGLALAGGAAVVAFAGKAVDAFTDAAISAGKFGDTAGIGVEDASKWRAVADDIGVSGESMEKAFGKLNLAVAANKPEFEKYNIEIAKTASGQTDTNQTMLNAIDAIKGIKDPAEKARAAQALLGKGWTDMAEMIGMGSEELKTAMDAVSEAQVIDEGELAKAKKMRESMDNLQDSFSDILLQVGEELTPVMATLADVMSTIGPIVADVIGVAADAFEGMTDFAYDAGKAIADFLDVIPGVDLGGLPEGIEHTVYEFEKLERHVRDNISAWDEGTNSMDELIQKLRDMGLSQDEINLATIASKHSLNANKIALDEKTAATEEAIDAQKEQKEAIDAAALAEKEHTGAIKETIEQLQEQAETLQEAVDARRAATDSTFALHDAEEEWADQIETVDANLLEASEDLLAQRGILDDVAQSAGKVADANAKVAEDTAKANGTVLTATQRMDSWNASMVTQASQVSGPSRTAILDYISTVNGIPANKMTAIAAAMEAGDIEQVNWLINDASRSRQSTISADADTAEAERKLNNLERPRNVRVTATGSGVLGYTAVATGDQYTQAGSFLVGEEGPELINLPRGSRVIPNRNIGVGGGNTYISNHYPAGTHPTDVANSQRKYQRRQGPI